MPLDDDYQRVAAAIDFIRTRWRDQPELAAIAAHVGLSPYHFQRLFVRWAGVSPKRFLGYLTVQHAKRLLREQRPLLETALESGLSGSGRLHDQFVTIEAVSPGEYKRQGAGLTLQYCFYPTPFGRCGVLRGGRGICAIRFIDDSAAGRRGFLAEMQAEWPQAELVGTEVDDPALEQALAGEGSGEALRLWLRGSPFQLQVWRALLQIPQGSCRGYREVAEAIGRPRAARSVGSAIGTNPVAFLIPCHRVLRSDGSFSGYRWGEARQMSIFGWERARQEPASEAQDQPAGSAATAEEE